jgi:hypothetical protein
MHKYPGHVESIKYIGSFNKIKDSLLIKRVLESNLQSYNDIIERSNVFNNPAILKN